MDESVPPIVPLVEEGKTSGPSQHVVSSSEKSAEGQISVPLGVLKSRISNPFDNPRYSGVGVLTSALLEQDVFAHQPDPNNGNYPLCWQGVNRIETGEESKLIIAWIPHLMTCQDCLEWIHA